MISKRAFGIGDAMVVAENLWCHGPDAKRYPKRCQRRNSCARVWRMLRWPWRSAVRVERGGASLSKLRDEAIQAVEVLAQSDLGVLVRVVEDADGSAPAA